MDKAYVSRKAGAGARYTSDMRTPIRLFTFLIFASLAFAQLDSNSVTVTASRNTNLQADQVVFSVTVTSGMDVSLNDIVAALQSSGITLSNFIGVNTNSQFTLGTGLPSQQPMLQWVFGLPVAISKLKDTAATLSSLQQSIAKNNPGLALSFAVQGTQVSAPLQQSQVCSVADLISDARIQAQKLATAAGMNLGSVLAMSSGVATATSGSGVYIGIPVGAIFSSSVFSSPLAPPCAATVKFALK
jgi:hypothetical protein